jgi:hypothetical protein
LRPDPGWRRHGRHHSTQIRIDNFGRISDTYYGRAARPGRLRQPAALGVKTVINLTSDDARREPGMVEGMQPWRFR